MSECDIFDKVTRVEVINHRKDSNSFGRVFTEYSRGKIFVSLQDDQRTLKIFLSDKNE